MSSISWQRCRSFIYHLIILFQSFIHINVFDALYMEACAALFGRFLKRAGVTRNTHRRMLSLACQMDAARRKVEEAVRRMERSDKQVDMLVVKLERRTKLFDEERRMWYKEFLMLKEAIRRAGFADDSFLIALEGTLSVPGSERDGCIQLADCLWPCRGCAFSCESRVFVLHRRDVEPTAIAYICAYGVSIFFAACVCAGIAANMAARLNSKRDDDDLVPSEHRTGYALD